MIVEPKVPYLVNAVPAQLGPDDRKIYYSAAKHCLSHDGVLVDCGTLAGGTSVALAAGGLTASVSRNDCFLHAFDQFVCDWATPEFFKAAFGGEWSTGSNFRHVYDDVVSPFSRFVCVHEGDLLNVREWSGPPIDVLGVDVWKTAELANHSLRLFFTSLRPGSLVLQQDYMTVWLPWIHTYMEALSRYFERVYEAEFDQGCTIAFRTKSEIPMSAIDDVFALHLDIHNVRRLMKNAVGNAQQAATSICIQLAHTVMEKRLAGLDAAIAWLDRIDVSASDERFFEERRAEMKAYVSTSWAL